MPRLELDPALDGRNASFDTAGTTGPSQAAASQLARELVFEGARITTGRADRELALLPGIGRCYLVTVYMDDAPGEPTGVAVSPAPIDLAEAIDGIRRSSGLPVNEVAAMVGLSRRGLYKVREEGRSAAGTERHIYRVASAISRLAERLGTPERVRAALLTPLRPLDGRTLVAIAGTRDERDLQQAVEVILSQEGSNAVEAQWKRTRPLASSGASAGAFIREHSRAE